jgi:hypothetical protein
MRYEVFFILGVFHSNVGDCEFVGEVCPTSQWTFVCCKNEDFLSSSSQVVCTKPYFGFQ